MISALWNIKAALKVTSWWFKTEGEVISIIVEQKLLVYSSAPHIFWILQTNTTKYEHEIKGGIIWAYSLQICQHRPVTKRVSVVPVFCSPSLCGFAPRMTAPAHISVWLLTVELLCARVHRAGGMAGWGLFFLSLLNYKTAKFVIAENKRIGILFRLYQLAVLGYLIGWGACHVTSVPTLSNLSESDSQS